MTDTTTKGGTASHSLLQRLQAILNQLVEPARALTDSSKREQSRFLSVFLLTIIVISLGLSIASYLTSADKALDAFSVFVLASIGILVGLYILNRAGHYQIAAVCTILMISLLITIASLPYDEPGYLTTANFFVLTVLLGASLLPLRYVVILVIIQEIIAAVLTWYTLQLSGEPLSQFFSPASPFGFTLIISILILIVIDQRNQIEAMRSAELLESESRYRTLVEMSPDAIVLAHEDRLIYLNPAAEKMLGLNVADAQGIRPADLVHPEDREVAHNIIRNNIREQVPMRERLVLPNKTIIEVEALGAPVRVGGKVMRQTVLRDIRERLVAEQQTLELAVERARMRMLEMFISDTSHDLRTPITALTTSAYVIQQYLIQLLERLSGLSPAPEGVESLTEVLKDRIEGLRGNADRLTQLLNVMLDMVRLDQHASYKFQPTDLNLFGHDMFIKFEEESRRKGCDLIFIPSPQPVVASVDSHEFGRVAQNLVENAVRYSLPNGKITLRTFLREDHVVFEVSDTGLGISEEDLPYIFDRFFRADKARASHTGGSGLGLSIVKKIVDVHGGKIEVESAAGKGSTFRVILPALTS